MSNIKSVSMLYGFSTVDGKLKRLEHNEMEGRLYSNNHPQYIEGSLVILQDYSTLTKYNFKLRNDFDGTEIGIISIASQDSDHITFNLSKIPNTTVSVFCISESSYRWRKLTPVGTTVTINSTTQDIIVASNTYYQNLVGFDHLPSSYNDVNSTVNESLVRIKKVAVDVVGMIDEETTTMDYSSNNILTDNSTIKSSLEAFDSKFGNESEIINSHNIVSTESIESNLNDLDVAIGSRTYTNDNLLTDGESITTSLDKLDSKIGKETEILANNIVTATDNIEKQINSITSVIGERLYDYNDILTDQESVTDSFKAIDNFIHSEFYAEEFGYPAYQNFAFTTGTTVFNITQDEDCTAPYIISDFSKIVNNLDYFSVSTQDGSPIYSEGSVLKREANVVKVISFNSATGEVTLNFSPKTAFRINFMAIYNRKNVPNGKILNASNLQNIVDNSPTNEAGMIAYNNVASGLESTNVQEAIDEIAESSTLFSTGMINYPIITNNGDGSLTLSGSADIVMTDLDGYLHKYNVSVAKSFTPVDKTTSYIYFGRGNAFGNSTPYGSGTYGTGTYDVENYEITVSITTDLGILSNDFTKVLMFRVNKDGNDLNFDEYNGTGEFLSNKLLVKDIIVRGFERLSGLGLSTTTGNNIKIDNGKVYFGINNYSLSEFNTGTNELYNYYLVGGTWNLSSNQTAFDSTYYSDGTNRLSLDLNKWVSIYVYRDIGDVDNKAYYIYGNQYNTEALAIAEILPLAPTYLTSHALYVGKIVIQQGSTLGTAYSRTWGQTIVSSGAINHDDLSNIQQAGSGITNGHISAGTQTIYGEKTFDDNLTVNGNIIATGNINATSLQTYNWATKKDFSYSYTSSFVMETASHGGLRIKDFFLNTTHILLTGYLRAVDVTVPITQSNVGTFTLAIRGKTTKSIIYELFEQSYYESKFSFYVDGDDLIITGLKTNPSSGVKVSFELYSGLEYVITKYDFTSGLTALLSGYTLLEQAKNSFSDWTTTGEANKVIKTDSSGNAIVNTSPTQSTHLTNKTYVDNYALEMAIVFG